MSEKKLNNLFGLSLSDLNELVAQHKWPGYTARQIAEWLYKHHVTDFGQMSNLSAKIRNELSSLYTISCPPPVQVQTAADGTKKYLFTYQGKGSVETAYIPEVKRHTLCLSSQIGCRMGCSFCMTARMGFKANLTAGEIINQLRSIPEREVMTNIVYMGMGEPLDNLDNVLKSLEILVSDWGYGMSNRRITLSTIGILPAMTQFLEQSNCNLAISLHTPFDDERKSLIPAAKPHSLSAILDTIKSYPVEKQRRISFEYIVFDKLNNTGSHVKALARVLNHIRCRINLIAFHPIPGSPLRPASPADMEFFRAALENKGIITTIRKSRGQDIQAACGLLAVDPRNK